MKKLTVTIQRSESKIDTFEVAFQEGMTVLEVLQEIYQSHDPTLAYRFSCRTGLCATCSMLINHKPGLSCMKLAVPGEDGHLTLAPLPKRETIKDLLTRVE